MDSERFSVLDGLFAGPVAGAPEASVPGAGAPEASGAQAAAAGETGDSPANAPEPAGFADLPAPATGDPRVDDAVAGLASLGTRPLEEHPRAFEAAHDTLRALLGELGEPGRPGRPGQQGHQGELGGDR